jgi:hypothetical protein
MRWTPFVLALLLVAGLGLAVAPAAQAQERDGCQDTRFGRMGCVTDVQPFNFDDPGISQYSASRIRGAIVVYSDSHIEQIPEGQVRLVSRTWFPGTGR